MASQEQIIEWTDCSSSELKRFLKDPKGYSKDNKETIKAILKSRKVKVKND